MTEWQGLTIPQLEGFTGFVPPEGAGTYSVALIGEAPGEMEARYGKPFYEKAPAGSVLNRLLNRAGLDRSKFVISNAVWSRPPQNYLEGARYEGEAISAYQPFREALFNAYRPRVFLALGGVALRTLSHYGGKGAGITACQGYVLDGPWNGTYVIGALHPSAIMRGEQRMSGVVIWALQRAVNIARNGFVRLPTHYITHPSLDDALEFERNYHADTHVLSYDIETAESSSLDEEEVEDKDEDISYNITRISLCYDASGYAISLPWQPPYIDVAKRLLFSHGPKRVWNGNFDNPRLAAAGSAVLGRIYDSMWAWKFLQPTLPRSLGFVAPFYNWTGEPWKNTSNSEPEVYSCKDAHALQLIGDGVDAHLRQKGQWHVYERHVVELGEVLTKMAENGLPYDQAKADTFSLELRQKWDERFTELQRRVPDDLKPSKQKTGYAKVPKELTGLVQREFPVLNKETMEITREQRWCKLEPFLPTSHVQVKDLIRHFGHNVGKARKTKNDTADDDTLKKLLKKTRNSKKPRDTELSELLQMIRECRQLSKVQGTYVKGWKPGRDGRIHATPGHWGAMMRISWRRPNISATIQDKTEASIANGFRKCVSVSNGRLLLESDWKGIEGVLVGFFADDQDYMRLAKIGVHDYFCAHILASKGKISEREIPSLALSDAELKPIFRELKRRFPKDRDDAKHCIAEGELVLTDSGLVPIESVTIQHRLWDGTDWVKHSGVVYQGEREIIHYEGLRATPDHEVITQAGYIQTFGRVASSLGRLETTGDRRQAIRTRHSDFLRTASQVRGYLLANEMYGLWKYQMDMPQPIDSWTLQGMQRMWQSKVQVSARAGQTLRRYSSSMLRQQTSIVSSLWWTWYCLQIQIAQRLRAMDREEPPSSNLSRNNHRQDQQRWALRTGESTVGNSTGASKEYEYMVEKARTYDILNAGLRRCFTVSGKLVLNCIHGQNFGMRPRLMADMYEMRESEAKRLQEMYFDLFPKIRVWQRSVLDRASRECRLRNPFGYEMPFWEVYRWDAKYQRYTLGEDAKSAIAFLPRDTAAAMLKEVLLRLRYLADEGVMLCSTHDSITCEVAERDLNRVARILKTEMERGVPELGDLKIGVELKAGNCWHGDSMEVLDLTAEEATPYVAQDSSALSAQA